MTELEKRLHRCCFTGHRPEKLKADEPSVKAWLSTEIDKAIVDGYRTFITGAAMGVDIWAGQIVVEKRRNNPDLHLIAAVPWPGFSSKWNEAWRGQYDDLIRNADLVIYVKNTYEDHVFHARNKWMIDHSNRIIAYFNGERGTSLAAVDDALSKKLEVIVGGIIPDFSSYVAYDLETTGLSPEGDDIIEIGAIRIVNGLEADTFREFVKPAKKEISDRVAALTGITNDHVAGARGVDRVMADFAEFVGKDPLVGFNNVSFDARFLEAAGPKLKNRQFDVMLYAMQFQKALGFQQARVSLKALNEKLRIQNPQAHRALADAITTARCFERLKQLGIDEQR